MFRFLRLRVCINPIFHTHTEQSRCHMALRSCHGSVVWLVYAGHSCTTDEERRELEDLCGQLMVHREMLGVSSHPVIWAKSTRDDSYGWFLWMIPMDDSYGWFLSIAWHLTKESQQGSTHAPKEPWHLSWFNAHYYYYVILCYLLL
jgi:hypothetical protein